MLFRPLIGVSAGQRSNVRLDSAVVRVSGRIWMVWMVSPTGALPRTVR